MKFKQTLLTLAALSCFASFSSAATTFSFHDGSNTIGTGLVFDDAAGSIQDTQGSFTLTAEAFLDGVSTGSFFNGATTAFGINADGSGDSTQEFDDDNGTESMVFSFNTAGIFSQIDLVGINITNEATLSFAGGGSYNISSSTNDITLINEAFTAGQLITLSTAAAGSNFGLESFTVVPEPNTYAMLAGICALGFVMVKRRRS